MEHGLAKILCPQNQLCPIRWVFFRALWQPAKSGHSGSKRFPMSTPCNGHSFIDTANGQRLLYGQNQRINASSANRRNSNVSTSPLYCSLPGPKPIDLGQNVNNFGYQGRRNSRLVRIRTYGGLQPKNHVGSIQLVIGSGHADLLDNVT
ncbi:hypothetical protein GCM10019059_12560 [Camelimonas fluminis]|nr:hypothetical protein GCM10019059_12560 [Camelimonas fluminis]